MTLNWDEDSSEFDKSFIKSYNEEGYEAHFLEVDIQYPENVDNPHSDLPFLPQRMKIEKIPKLVANLPKTVYYPHKKFKTSFKPWASVKKGT